MGICFSLPDKAVDSAQALAKGAGAQWAQGIETSGRAAAKAARRAKLTKYALVGCEFDAETAAQAKRLSTIRELLFDQQALWKAWSTATLAMDFSVLMHWSKHCHANEECAKRLRQVALQVHNASVAHSDYVEFMQGKFVDVLDAAIDCIEEGWCLYEAYEKAEYDYRWALKTRRQSQEANKEVIAELEKAKSAALKEAKKAIAECEADVEHKILVPLYQLANRALDDFAKQCSKKREVKEEKEEKALVATFERANSIAYTKLKKRTYTASDAINAAKKAVVGQGDLPESFVTINNNVDEMKRHGLALSIVFADFTPYIKIIFGPDRMNDFADEMCKKIDGYKVLKRAAAQFNDKVAALTSDIDVQEFQTLCTEFDQVIRMECSHISADADAYLRSLQDITRAEKNLEKAEQIFKAQSKNFVLPPVDPKKLEKFNVQKEAWNGALKDAQDAVSIAKERSVSELQNHADRYEALCLKKDSTFHTFIIVTVENACAVVTEAHKTIHAIKPRTVQHAAEAPEEEEVVEAPKLDFEEAEESWRQAKAAKEEVEASLKAKEEADRKAKEAEIAAEKARLEALAEADEKKKQEKLAKAAEEEATAKAEAETKAAAEAKALEAAKIEAQKVAEAEAVAQKVTKQLEDEVAAADKKAEAEIAVVEKQEQTQAIVRQATIKSIQENNASMLEKSMQATQSLREEANADNADGA
jgi:hypothetical protein